MTKRKSELRRSSRELSYVSQESGAAELEISPQTWREWVRSGILPPPHPGFPPGTRRWLWSEVQDYLAGRRPVAESSTGTVEDFIAKAARFRNAKKKGCDRALAA